METLIESEIRSCLVCGVEVEVDASVPEENTILCILHFFSEDASEEWEQE